MINFCQFGLKHFIQMNPQLSEGSQKQQTYELVRLSYYGKTLLICQTLSNSRLLLVK